VTKPILYIDVDGVLFGLYGEPTAFQLRPGVNSFLTWADEMFVCKWLTCWGQERLIGGPWIYHEGPVSFDDISKEPKPIWGLLPLLYVAEGMKFEHVDWKNGKQRYAGDAGWRGADKIDAIDVENEDFYWLEDGIGERAEKILRRYGKLNRYIYVNELGDDGLVYAKAELEKRLAARKTG